MYLNSILPTQIQVGYGELGLNGELGYERKQVMVNGQTYRQAFSTHPPARLAFQLDGRFASFRSEVALNDDVAPGASHAHFSVMADGREVAVESYVRAGEPPRTLIGDITGAKRLELIVRTSCWECCHAVWLDPEVNEAPAPPTRLVDCLGRAEIILPPTLLRSERCVATVVSPGFEHFLDDMLGSLYANSRCTDALVVVFILNTNEICERIAAKYQATVVRCFARTQINPMSKAVLYSAARLIDARQFLCLDADMLVLGDLDPIFSALDACPEGSLLACREGNNGGFNHLGQAMRLVYGGGDVDLQRLAVTEDEAAYPLVVNDGIFAAGRSAMLGLDGVIRSMSHASSWVDGNHHIWWRNQFIFNLALARLRCGVELDSAFNVQLHAQDVEFKRTGARLHAEWRNRPVKIVHFSGVGKHKYSEWKGSFSNVPDPLVGANDGDNYQLFVRALRSWLGRYGLSALAWSFYGVTDGTTGRVRDASVFPLFATLHYLVRANGCERVIETGTARGISAGCLASAVAHRNQGRVVTLDPYLHEGREELWATLPESFSRRIEPRLVDALQGMEAALEAGETYEAALLDSIHTEEHVWAEFRLATKLVCPGGLILIHDACYANGTVEGALQIIENAGYGVVRLWTAENGVVEDDHLGLALIENRPHRSATKRHE